MLDNMRLARKHCHHLRTVLEGAYLYALYELDDEQTKNQLKAIFEQVEDIQAKLEEIGDID